MLKRLVAACTEQVLSEDGVGMAVQGDVPVALAQCINILSQTDGSPLCQDTYCFFEDLLFRLFKVLGRPASELFRCDFSGETGVARLHLDSASLSDQQPGYGR